ncbi:Gfo/Idh/MocA family protein [Enterococcus olivae]
MKIGVIGLGGIAQKAYLPTYVALQHKATFFFATRNQDVQKQLKEKYQLRSMKNNLQELIDEGIEACFIHSATTSHYGLVKECLLNDLHVFVDKPLSENYQEVLELQALAKQKNKLLMLGFNRRFAPLVSQLKELPEKRMILLQKNRAHSIQPTAFEIYDLFLHLVDTAVYLLDEPILAFDSYIRESETGMETAFLRLETAQTSAVLTMDLKSGANREVFQVSGPQGTYLVEDLTTLKKIETTGTSIETFGDWQNTLEKRGFQQMVEQFLEAVASGEDNHLKQEKIGLSHELCCKMLKQHEEGYN